MRPHKDARAPSLQMTTFIPVLSTLVLLLSNGIGSFQHSVRRLCEPGFVSVGASKVPPTLRTNLERNEDQHFLFAIRVPEGSTCKRVKITANQYAQSTNVGTA